MSITWDVGKFDNPEQFAIEVAKCAPENHRNATEVDGKVKVWCPWAWDTVVVSPDWHGWPTCSVCLRQVDLEKASAIRT